VGQNHLGWSLTARGRFPRVVAQPEAQATGAQNLERGARLTSQQTHQPCRCGATLAPTLTLTLALALDLTPALTPALALALTLTMTLTLALALVLPLGLTLDLALALQWAFAFARVALKSLVRLLLLQNTTPSRQARNATQQ